MRVVLSEWCNPGGAIRVAQCVLTLTVPADLIPRSPGQVAQLVEQRTENPRVGSSILPLATILISSLDPRHLLPTRSATATVRRPVRFCPSPHSNRAPVESQ
jgi:hypothetical protein